MGSNTAPDIGETLGYRQDAREPCQFGADADHSTNTSGVSARHNSFDIDREFRKIKMAMTIYKHPQFLIIMGQPCAR